MVQEEHNIENVDQVTENIVRRYISDLHKRKYTAYVKDTQRLINYPERRRDYRQQVSIGTINNYTT